MTQHPPAYTGVIPTAPTATYDVGGPEGLSVASEQAAAAALTATGPTIDQLVNANGHLNGMLFLETFMPAFKGHFSTSSQVPFVPVSWDWTHVLGISSAAFFTYNNDAFAADNTTVVGVQPNGGQLVAPASGGPAHEIFNFVSSAP